MLARGNESLLLLVVVVVVFKQYTRALKEIAVSKKDSSSKAPSSFDITAIP